MDRPRIQESITEQFFQQLEQSKHLHYPLMKRVQGRIRTKEQLERYIRVLAHKLEARQFRDEWLVDHLDQVLMLHERFERYEQSGTTTANEYWDALATNGN
jgi:hypothetical protein